MNKQSGRGRRPGQSDAREQIRLAARVRFLAEGYQAVTMRTIAADAGVDVALVSYYFGSKQGVFGEAMAMSANPAQLIGVIVAGDPSTLPERALRTMLAVWDDPATGAPLRTLASTATADPAMRKAVGEFLTRELIGGIQKHLTGPDTQSRAAVFSAQMAGLIFSRYLVGIEPIASMSIDEIVERLAPSLAIALEPRRANG
jgi:AcrR family transcriptional regulator